MNNPSATSVVHPAISAIRSGRGAEEERKSTKYLVLAVESKTTVYPDLTFASDVEFFRNIVWFDYQEFLQNPTVRSAFHIASSLNHTMDWHWHAILRTPESAEMKWKNFSEFRKHMVSRCPKLALIRNLCDASKHCGLDRAPVSLDRVAVATLAKDGAGAYGGPGGYNLPASAYSRAEATILLFTDKKERYDFREVATAAFAHWNSVLMPRASSGFAG